MLAFSLAIGIVLIVSLLYVIYLQPDEVTIKVEFKEGIAKIISVAHEPVNPLLGEKITVTAVVENSSECNLQWKSYFTEGKGGGWSMEQIGNGRYTYGTYSGYENGTELFFRICAVDSDGGLTVSDEHLIQIGTVERSNITTLTVSNVHHSPEHPNNSKDVTIRATVTSNVTISQVEFIAMWFCTSSSGKCSGGSIGDEMLKESENTSENVYIFNQYKLFDFFPKDVPIFYKVVAQDESGNTAVSPIFSLIVS